MENAGFPAQRRIHAQLRRHRPARSAQLTLLRAGGARRAARIRVRVDLRLPHPLAGVLRHDAARRGPHVEDQARPLRDEPGHPRPDDHGQLVRHDAGPLERPDGDGHRSRRLVPSGRRPETGPRSRVRTTLRDDQRADERTEGRLERQRARADLGQEGRPGNPDVDRRLWAQGACGRGPRSRRRDHPARRPGDHRMDHGHRQKGRRGGRPRPVRAEVHRRRAEPHLGRPGRRAQPGPLVPGDGLEPRHGPDREVRLGVRDPRGADRLRQGSEVLRLQGPQPSGSSARRVRDGRALRSLLRPRRRRAGDGEAEGARGRRRRPVQYLPHDAQPGRDARRLRRRDHPAVRPCGRLMAEVVPIQGTEATAKIRSVVWVIVLEIITLFIYGFFWWYFIHRELRDYGRAKNTNELGTSPGTSLLAITLGALIIVPALVSFYNGFKRVQAAQRLTGIEPINGWIGLILFLVFYPAFMGYMQSGLNAVWQAQAAATPPTTPTA